MVQVFRNFNVSEVMVLRFNINSFAQLLDGNKFYNFYLGLKSPVQFFIHQKTNSLLLVSFLDFFNQIDFRQVSHPDNIQKLGADLHVSFPGIKIPVILFFDILSGPQHFIQRILTVENQVDINGLRLCRGFVVITRKQILSFENQASR